MVSLSCQTGFCKASILCNSALLPVLYFKVLAAGPSCRKQRSAGIPIPTYFVLSDQSVIPIPTCFPTDPTRYRKVGINFLADPTRYRKVNLIFLADPTRYRNQNYISSYRPDPIPKQLFCLQSEIKSVLFFSSGILVDQDSGIVDYNLGSPRSWEHFLSRYRELTKWHCFKSITLYNFITLYNAI